MLRLGVHAQDRNPATEDDPPLRLEIGSVIDGPNHACPGDGSGGVSLIIGSNITKDYVEWGRTQNGEEAMPLNYSWETNEEIECPNCGHAIPIRSRTCPECEAALH